MSSNKAKHASDDERSVSDRSQRRGSNSSSVPPQPPPPVPPPFHSFALQHAAASKKKKKQRKQPGSFIPPPLQAFAHRNRRGSESSSTMSGSGMLQTFAQGRMTDTSQQFQQGTDMSISGLTDSVPSMPQHIPPPFEMWPHPVNYEHQSILSTGASEDFITPLSKEEVSMDSSVSSDSKKSGSRASKTSSEARLSRRLGWGKGEEEKAAKKDPPTDSKKPAVAAKNSARGDDAEKLVHEMLRAPDTLAINKLVSRMKDRPRRKSSIVPSDSSREGVVQSKYGGFEYQAPSARNFAAKKKEKRDRQTTSRRSSSGSNLRSIMRAPSIVAIKTSKSLHNKGNLSFSTSRRGDDDSDASSAHSVDSLSTVKSRRGDSWNNSVEDMEKGILPQPDTTSPQLPSMDSSEQTNVTDLLNSCKVPSVLFMIRMITVTALAFFAVTLVLWQVHIHQDIGIAASAVQNQAPTVSFPTQFNNLAELARPLSPEADIPFFWHVPVTAGVMVQSILGQCYGLTQASNFWAQGFHDEEALEINDVSGLKYVNVDTDSPSDVERAMRLDFAKQNLADVVISPNLHVTSPIFTMTHTGRMFTMLRNPIERAQSMYYILSEQSEDVAQMTIEDYVKSDYVENNWLTRYLLNEMGKLTPDHLEIAKEILRRKCLIGLTEEPLESIERFTNYFQWYDEETHNSQCQKNIIDEVTRAYQDHTPPEEGGEVWNLLMKHNVYDMEIYQYARELFDEQRGIVSDV